MTPERFAQLADAYGGNLQRWPTAEQRAAAQLLASDEVSVTSALRQARQLDGFLDSHRADVPDRALLQSVRRAGHTAVAAKPSFWGRYAGWFSRAGFVGAGLAGVAAGMLVASMSLPIETGHEALPNIFDSGDAEIVLNLGNEEGEQ